MKRLIYPFVILVAFIGIWLGLLICLYQKGQEKEAIIYAKIPNETIQFFAGILDSIDQFITFDPDTRIDDWDNDKNYGEDEETGLLKLEDDYFIFYFAKGNVKEEERAKKVQRWAHEAIQPLAALMGKYHYPEDVKGRKLPIYLADTQKAYTYIISILLSRPNIEEQKGSWGMYICTYSELGCLTKGIVLHPDTWRTDKDAQSTLWHEMNHYEFYSSLDFSKIVDPYLWVSEGLAEYFSKEYPKLTQKDMERLNDEHLDKTFKYTYDNYIGGQSVYQTLYDKYGEQKLKEFIQQIYSNRMENVYPKSIQVSRSHFEKEWKIYLAHFN
ncbi:hypothetical protein [Bacteroides bouchesdurhonensis]